MPKAYVGALPSVIDDPHPYVGLGDLQCVLGRFALNIPVAIVAKLQDDCFNVLCDIVPPEASLVNTSAQHLNEKLEEVILHEVSRDDGHVGVVMLDRYIAAQQDLSSLFRLNASRDKSYRQIVRPGTRESVEEQYHNLYIWRTENGFDEIIVMDDVLGTGATLIQTINELRKATDLSHQKIRAFTGIATSGGTTWAGIEKLYKATGIDPEYLVLVKASEPTASSSGLCIASSRDMTLLGGFLARQPGRITRSLPNFLPYTITSPMNPTDPQKRALAAEQLLAFNRQLFSVLARFAAKPLTMEDLVQKGFGIPASNLVTMQDAYPQPSLDTEIEQHLMEVARAYERNMDKVLREVGATQM